MQSYNAVKQELDHMSALLQVKFTITNDERNETFSKCGGRLNTLDIKQSDFLMLQKTHREMSRKLSLAQESCEQLRYVLDTRHKNDSISRLSPVCISKKIDHISRLTSLHECLGSDLELSWEIFCKSQHELHHFKIKLNKETTQNMQLRRQLKAQRNACKGINNKMISEEVVDELLANLRDQCAKSWKLKTMVQVLESKNRILQKKLTASSSALSQKTSHVETK